MTPTKEQIEAVLRECEVCGYPKNSIGCQRHCVKPQSEVESLREAVRVLTEALTAIIHPNNEREIRFDSDREYYVADIEGGELARAVAALARVKELGL